MAETIESQSTVSEVASPVVDNSSTATNTGYGSERSTVARTSSVRRVSGNETGRRIVLLLFGIVQLTIVIRFVLLLLNANSNSGIVSAIHGFSQIFVAPFVGIFSNASSGGSTFEMASVAALIGWTVVEFLVLAVLQIVTRRPQGTSS